MLIEIGHVEAIFRYPVKSMGGERLEAAKLGWHGIDGDVALGLVLLVELDDHIRTVVEALKPIAAELGL